MRRLLGAAVVVGGPLLLFRRHRVVRREHVELHFDDGSTVTLGAGSRAADGLLTLARRAL